VSTIEQRAAYAVILLCTNPACDPASYKLCTDCKPVFDAAFPDRCADPNCDACTDRGAAEAARAEQ
jgi:hypothetical protein